MEGCARIMKYILVGFNVLVLLVGAAAIGLGAWSLTSEYGAEEMQSLTGSEFYRAACIVVIVGGCVIVAISFLGCCGAFMENRVMLGIYFVIMLLFLIVFVVAAVLGFFFRDDLEQELSDEMEDTLLKKYGVDTATNSDNKAVTEVWDKVQEKLHCCGVSGGLTDTKSWFLWQSSTWFTTTQQGSSLNKKGVPTSCCNIDGGAFSQCQNFKTTPATGMPIRDNLANVNDENPALFHEGCIDKLKDKIEDHLVAIAAIAVVVLVVMLCCIIFAVCVCMEVRKQNMVV